LVVVSGLALGIDGIAHDAALTAGGITVAVLPSGMDRIYPVRHQRLAERVMAEGALVSEFPLGTPPRKHHFHRRNRTLSGFSEATLVVEAGRPSGTLITAGAAADQGRDVLVLPWSIYHREGAGCRHLLEDGAMLVQSVEAMQAHLGVPTAPPASLPQSHLPASAGSYSVSTLDADQQAMLTLLGSGTHGADTLSATLNWDINRCLACLTALEVSGRVRWVSGGYTVIA
jgi:DNA processing protein